MHPAQIVAILALLAVWLITLAVWSKLFGVWLRATLAGAKINMMRLTGMVLRKVDLKVVVDSYIMAVKGGLDIGLDHLEIHHLARGNVQLVVMALIAAKKAHYPLTFAQAAAIDLAGRNPLDEVREGAVDWEYEFDQMGTHTSKPIEGTCGDGSRVGASAKVRYGRPVKRGPSEEFPLHAEIAIRVLAYINDADSFADLERARERHESQLLDFGKAAMRGRLKSLQLRYFRL
jgi:hypothetical protein